MTAEVPMKIHLTKEQQGVSRGEQAEERRQQRPKNQSNNQTIDLQDVEQSTM